MFANVLATATSPAAKGSDVAVLRAEEQAQRLAGALLREEVAEGAEAWNWASL